MFKKKKGARVDAVLQLGDTMVPVDSKSPLDSFACFLFQAEDGIRDADVTGVQTCALPIYWSGRQAGRFRSPVEAAVGRAGWNVRTICSATCRSEERRVGKECRSRWSP